MLANPSAALIEKLGRDVRRCAGRHLSADSPVILLDVPHHMNVGDHAITAGELAMFDAMGLNLVHASVGRLAGLPALKRRFPEATVALHGGGNLGDLWPAHQTYREAVLETFADNTVVQLPQSLAFGQGSRLEGAKRSFAAHPAFTLLVRDSSGVEFASQEFDCRVELCPDSAFALGILDRPREPDVDVLCLARTDHEGTEREQPGVATVDWPQSLDRVERRLARWSETLSGDTDRLWPGRDRSLRGMLGRLAVSRLGKGTQLLARGRSVASNRLHAHILCLLLGIPHCVSDTTSGKVHDFIDTWTRDSVLVNTADSLSAARGRAAELL